MSTVQAFVRIMRQMPLRPKVQAAFDAVLAAHEPDCPWMDCEMACTCEDRQATANSEAGEQRG